MMIEIQGVYIRLSAVNWISKVRFRGDRKHEFSVGDGLNSLPEKEGVCFAFNTEAEAIAAREQLVSAIQLDQSMKGGK